MYFLDNRESDIKFPDGNRVSFCPFCLQATLNITVVNDDEVEGIEEMELMMNISSELASYVRTHGSVNIKIIDDDCKFPAHKIIHQPDGHRITDVLLFAFNQCILISMSVKLDNFILS